MPSQLDDDVNTAARLQVHPKVLLLGAAIRQIDKVDGAVGDEFVGRQRGIVKDGEADALGALQFVYEALVPQRIERLWFGGGTIWMGGGVRRGVGRICY